MLPVLRLTDGTPTPLGAHRTENERGVADERDAGRGGQPFAQYPHLGAIAVDGQFGETSLPFGLDHRSWPDAAQAVGTSQRHRCLNLNAARRHCRRGSRDAEDLTGEEGVHVHRPIGQDRDAVNTGQSRIRWHPEVEFLRAGLQAMNPVRE